MPHRVYENEIEVIRSLDDDGLYRAADIASLCEPNNTHRRMSTRKRLNNWIREQGCASIKRGYYQGSDWKANAEAQKETSEPPSTNRKRWLVAVALAAMVLTGLGINQSGLVSALLNHGVIGARKYLDANKPKTHRDMLDAAYLLIQEEKFEDGRQALYQVLGESNNARTKATAHYYLANLFLESGDYDSALAAYGESERLFDRNEDRISSKLGYVNALIHQERYGDATTHFEKIDGTGRNRQIYLSLRARLSFFLGDSLQALHLSLERLRVIRETGARFFEAHALSDVGFYHGVLGNRMDCKRHTQEAESLFVTLGDSKGYHYNLINRVLLYRCSGDDVVIENQIRMYADTSNDQRLERFLELTLNLDCE